MSVKKLKLKINKNNMNRDMRSVPAPKSDYVRVTAFQ